MPNPKNTPAVFVAYGDDEFQRSQIVNAFLDELLPPTVDRGLALTIYEATQKPDQGGPTIRGVIEDLATLPFLSDRRVVVLRDADAFISEHRERLEAYVAAPARTGVLVLECRSFLKTTRLYKAVAEVGRIVECKKKTGRALIEFLTEQAGERGCRLSPDAASLLVDLVGPDAGMLSNEVEKLAIYAGDRAAIGVEDVTELIGQSREEKVFAVMDAAALGELTRAMQLWHQVLSTDPDAVYKSIGGAAFKLRGWLGAHRAIAAGERPDAVAPKVGMWGRTADLMKILQRLPARTLRRHLAALADLDTKSKMGLRSIENGVELVLVRLAASAA